ncbi:hypothetical protein LINPERPRIM_LOCUS11694, partial [Linum perenne]
MVLQMLKQHFEKFVEDKFRIRGDDILVACNTNLGGVEGIQNRDEYFLYFKFNTYLGGANRIRYIDGLSY